jgi:hypothetical protein
VHHRHVAGYVGDDRGRARFAPVGVVDGHLGAARHDVLVGDHDVPFVHDAATQRLSCSECHTPRRPGMRGSEHLPKPPPRDDAELPTRFSRAPAITSLTCL